MSALDFLLPWESQPKEGTLVSPEWPTTSFSFLGGQVGDVATKRLWSLGSTSSRGVDSYGRATSPGTAGNSITQAGISAAAQTKCTFVCVFRIDTGREYSFLARTSTSNSGFAIGNGTGNSGGLSYGLHKGGAATLSEVVLTAGVTYVMVASHDQASGEYYVVARPIRGGATLRASGTNATASLAGSGTASIGINASPNDFIGSVGLVWQAFEFLPEALSGIFLANPWQLFASQVIDVPASAGGGDPTVAVTNNLATTASGILVPALSLATTGNSATASQGTATPALSLATTGNAATASTGTPVASISLALTGNGATSSVGTVGIGGTTQALTGNAATASAGTPVAQISLALTGNASTASVGTVVPALSKALTGNAATTSAGTPTAALSLALAGNGATASAGTVAVPGVIVPSSNVATASSGTVSPGITVALTGNGVTASVGTVSPAIALALSGLAGTSSVGIVVPGLTKALTGNTATSAAGSVSVPTGDITLALSGNAATAAVGTVGVDQGSNSAWWTYTVAADNLTFTIPADDLTYSIDATTLAGAST